MTEIDNDRSREPNWMKRLREEWKSYEGRRRYAQVRLPWGVGSEHYGHEIDEIFQKFQDFRWVESGLTGDLLLYLVGASIGYEDAQNGKSKRDMLNGIPNEIMEAQERAKREAIAIDIKHREELYRDIRKALGDSELFK